MKHIFIALLAMGSTAFAQSGGENIIQRSAQKIQELKSLRYNIYAEEFGEKISADVTLTRKTPYPIFDIAQVKLMGLSMSDAGSKQVSFAFDGTRFEFMDSKINNVVRLDSPTNNRIARTGMIQYMLLVLPPFTQEKPFEPLLQALKSAEIVGDTTIYNVSCSKVKLMTEMNTPSGPRSSEAFWYFGKDDLLIRGFVSAYSRKFLKVLAVNEQYSDAYFALAPAGDVKKITGTESLSDGMLSIGSVAPDWTLPSPGMKDIKLSGLKGKVVLLDFWGTWCVPCIKAMPHIQSIYEHFKGKDVQVLGVSVEMEKWTDPAAFAKQKGFTYPIVLNGEQIAKLYKVVQFPSVYIIDKNGKIIHAEHGMGRENFTKDIIAKIEAALKN